MRKIIVKIALSTLLFMVLAAAAHAQNPVPDPDTLADPVQQGDPAVRTLPPGLDYVEDRRANQRR